MWIDAICINQRNPREQEHQIGLMRDIFEGCSQCIVWLGEEDDETEKALETLHWMHDNLHIFEWPCFDKSNPDYRIQLALEPSQRLLHRPWFSRTWTFQEFVLSREHEIRCGHFEIPFDLLLQSQQNLNIHQTSCCWRRANTHMLLDVRIQLDTDIYPLARARGYLKNTEDFEFLTILEDNCHRIATRDHDKVYGLVGLAPPGVQKCIIPDYRLEVSTVYAQPVVAYWQTNASLRPLIFVRKQKSQLCLPSWVPDWSSPSGELISHSRRWRLYDACGHYWLHPTVYDYRVLHVQGVKCDSVKTMCEVMEPSLKEHWFLEQTNSAPSEIGWIWQCMDTTARVRRQKSCGRRLFGEQCFSIVADRSRTVVYAGPPSVITTLFAKTSIRHC